MAENSELSKINKNFYENFLVAKLLLQKYGVLHSFHELQLKKYTIACCMISLGGNVSFDEEKKLVNFEIYTEKMYNKNGKILIAKGRFDKFKTWFKINNKRYRQEIDFINKNLNSWCKELLWGDETVVRIKVDGKQITE